MLTTSQVADKIGVTRQTVFNWIKAKKLPALKIGGAWRVWPEDVDAFINQHPNIGADTPTSDPPGTA
jgi:excisionase family DNA binding protein